MSADANILPNSSTKSKDEIQKDIALIKKRREHIQQQLKFFEFTWYGWLISSILGAVFMYMAKLPDIRDYTETSRVFLNLFLGAFIANFTYGYFWGAFRFMLNNRLRSIEMELIKAGADELQESIEENFFTKLVQINFKYLDQYYLQTQEQADKSFRLSATAAVTGLLIIVSGITMMYFGRTEPAYVTTSAGVLSEFIAAVFFYLYNRTILKMSQYHQKLVLTQNISLALKITDEMQGDQKAKSLELLVDRLSQDVNKHLSDTNEK